MPIKTLPYEDPQLNLTPMIDVILTLIIFFMVATKFNEDERSIDLKLPTTANTTSPKEAAAAPKIVNVGADGGIYLGSQAVSLEELSDELAKLKSQSPGTQVLVRGDRDASHGRMADVYAAVRKAGIPHLGIAVKSGAVKR